MENVKPGEIPQSESSTDIHTSDDLPSGNGTEQPDSHFLVTESSESEPVSSQNASDDPILVQESHTTIGETSTLSSAIDQTEKNNQDKLVEHSKIRGIQDDLDEQISSKTDSEGISHNVKDGSALPAIDQTEKDNQDKLVEDSKPQEIQDGLNEQISQKTDSNGISHNVEGGNALPIIDQLEKDDRGILIEDSKTREIQGGSDEQISQKTDSDGISYNVEDGSALPVIDQTEKDNQDKLVEDSKTRGVQVDPDEQISQKTDSTGISHNVEGGSALPAIYQIEKDNQDKQVEDSKTRGMHDGLDEQISQKTVSDGISHNVEGGSALSAIDQTEKDNQDKQVEDSKTKGIHDGLDEQISQKTDSDGISNNVEDGSALPTIDQTEKDYQSKLVEDSKIRGIQDGPNEQISQKTDFDCISHDVEDGSALPEINQTEKDDQCKLVEDPKIRGIQGGSDEQISQKTGSDEKDNQGKLVEDFKTREIVENSDEQIYQKIDSDFISHNVEDGSALPAIDQTEKDNQSKSVENSETQRIQDGSDKKISQKSCSDGSSHNVEDGSVLPSSNPKTGDSEIGDLVSSDEISLAIVDVGGVAFGSGNCVSDGQQSENVDSTSFESENNHHMKPPKASTQPHLTIATVAAESLQDTLNGHRNEDTTSVSSSRDPIDGNISLSSKFNDSKVDVENGGHIVQMDKRILPHLKIISSIDESPRFYSAKHVKEVDMSRVNIDTTAPFDSVKEAVSKFGEVAGRKSHRKQAVERLKVVEQQLEKIQQEIPEYRKQSEDAEEAKMQVLKELDSKKMHIEELKLRLEKAQLEENQAKQDSELAMLRVQEMEQGISDEASVAAKAQLEVAKARHEYAVSELKSITEELETRRKDYTSLIMERDTTVEKAEEAVSASKEVEKMVEDLSIELIATKEALDSAEAAQLEAEDKKIGAAMARDQDTRHWEKEVKKIEEEVQSLNQQIQSTKDMKLKLDNASALLVDLKAELANYMENKHKKETDEHYNDESQTLGTRIHLDIQEAMASAKKELEEVKLNIKKVIAEVDCLKVTADTLKAELEKEKSALATINQGEGMSSVVASLEAELNKSQSEITVVQAKEKQAREKMEELPRQLQKATQEADEDKSVAQRTREELCKAKEEAEQAKAAASIIDSRLFAAQKEIQAANASQKLALAAIKALQLSESARSTDNVDSIAGVILSIDEYYELSRRAHEADKHDTMRVEAFISQIEQAKQSESISLKKLEEVKREMVQRKEALRSAMHKAEKSRQGKLAVEKALRKWRAKHEQRRKSTESSNGASVEEKKENNGSEPASPTPANSVECSNAKTNGNKTETEQPSSEVKVVKKKKRTLFPKFFMFLSKKKSSKPSSH
ncbi:hypothetical protein V6N13_048103 [Hibiscus sabdariffa]|uniref:Uncharacterized protein n=1 Tax=Hibiscus sabdariffa TaxID=183260 RepID=A0ABR2F698_9ROSI